MKSAWLKKEDTEELLILFNGWGMDRRIGDHLLKESRCEEFTQDLLLCYDYSSVELDSEVLEEMRHYRRISLIAWSFGVWVAQQTSLPPVTGAIAINGTLFPVDAEKGIRPDIFEATLSTWSDENLQRFYRRMCSNSQTLALFSCMSPERPASDQQQELAQLKSLFLHHSATKSAWSYDHAIIGGRDLVFPAQQQFAAWKGVPATIISDMPHFPFFHFRNLQEVLACLSK